LRHKYEVFQCFTDFQNLVERQFNRKIRAVQTDWGGEYQSLNSLFKCIGIYHHVSCPHAHQQNGSTECKHRHIVEMGLTLLAHASVPLKFWDEAFLTAVFLINRLPSRVINNQSPYERLLDHPPDYTSLRTFGCAVWPHLRPYNSKKLEFHSKRCVFLGYSNLHKGFKCLDSSDGCVYISRDVVFNEDIFPFASLHPNAGARLRAEILLLPNSLYDPNATFGNASVSDRQSSSLPTNVVSSPLDDGAGAAENAGSDSAKNSANNGSYGPYYMWPNTANGGTDLGSDSPGSDPPRIDMSGSTPGSTLGQALSGEPASPT
jgi:hypothetical protein